MLFHTQDYQDSSLSSLPTAHGTVTAILVAGGFLSASAVLLGMAIQTVGLLYKDETFGLIGCGVTLVSLLLLAWTASPIAAVTLFGVVSLPHIGWWLMLVYAPVIFFAFHLVDWRELQGPRE